MLAARSKQIALRRLGAQRHCSPRVASFWSWGKEKGQGGGDKSSDDASSSSSSVSNEAGALPAYNRKAPVTVGTGDSAPRFTPTIGLPSRQRPLLPGHVAFYKLTHPDVIDRFSRSVREGEPLFVSIFLRKDSPHSKWGRATAAAGIVDDLDAGIFNSNSSSGVAGTDQQQQQQHEEGEQFREDDHLLYPEVITDLDQVYRMGTFARVIQYSAGMGIAHMLLESHRRVLLTSAQSIGPPLIVDVEHCARGTPFDPDSAVVRAYCNEVFAAIREACKLNPLLHQTLQVFYSQNLDVNNPFVIADFGATLTSADAHRVQAVLESMNIEDRLQKTLLLLTEEIEMLRLQAQIKQSVDEKLNKAQRTYMLNEQMRSIKKELGIEKDDKEALLTKFRGQLAAIEGIQPEPKKAIEDEIEKLSMLEKNSPEFNGTRNYLEWLTSLPWGKASQENFDLKRAKTVLDEDHYGLDDIKERILEFIAVGKLRGGVHGRILLFAGPPGVGKTSIGKSIARALNREFYRFSVGGLSDVAEIKGHRRTYVGAMPGKLIQALKASGTSNPLILIDEVDKLVKGYHGDPASALLEVLDPSQNGAFVDHYLDVPVDLSKALFICTANVMDTIPGPLRDRMETIWLSGYDVPEKVAISEQYLIPKAMKEGGLAHDATAIDATATSDTGADDVNAVDANAVDANTSHSVTSTARSSSESIASNIEKKSDVPDSLQITTEAVESLVRWYCREAGVRSLEKHIHKIVRKLALELVRENEVQRTEQPSPETASSADESSQGAAIISEAVDTISSSSSSSSSNQSATESEHTPRLDWTVTADNLHKYVGKPVFTSDRLYEDHLPAGVVMGLAWTAMGGTSLYIETSAVLPRVNTSLLAASKYDSSDVVSRAGVGALRMTGQMGGVMQESAQIAHHFARRELVRIDPDNTFFEKADIHMHVPEGATAKDGPSAGVTMVTSLLSLARDLPVRPDVAMTGEVSLTGKVLPVGGIKEKTIAARRAGVHCLVFPKGNRRDYDELPEYLKSGLEVHFAATYSDVYDVAFSSAGNKASDDVPKPENFVTD